MELGFGSHGKVSWYQYKKGGPRYAAGSRGPKATLSLTTEFGKWQRQRGLASTSIYNEIKKIEGRTAVGLEAAAEHLRESMDKIPPLVPISNEKKDKHLFETWYTNVKETPTGPTIEFGYEAPYTLYVHEMTEPPYNNVHWTRPLSGPKWLEIALYREQKNMLNIIRSYAEVI